MGKFDVPFSMDFVLRDLCIPHFKKEVPNRKGEVEIYCPLRESKTFEVNIRREQWNCFKKCADCPCGGAGGVLDLYVMFYGGDRKNAYKAIMEAVNGNADVASMVNGTANEEVQAAFENYHADGPGIIHAQAATKRRSKNSISSRRILPGHILVIFAVG